MTMTQWQERKRPVRLEKRYDFKDYEALRVFLDNAADLSEESGLYPDIGFGRTHANFTIHAEEGAAELTERQHGFARLLDALNTDSRG